MVFGVNPITVLLEVFGATPRFTLDHLIDDRLTITPHANHIVVERMRLNRKIRRARRFSHPPIIARPACGETRFVREAISAKDIFGRFEIHSERLSVDAERLSVDAEWFSVDAGWFGVDAGWFSVDAGWFSVDDGWSSVDDGWFSVDDGWFSVDDGWFSVDDGWFSVDDGWFSVDAEWLSAEQNGSAESGDGGNRSASPFSIRRITPADRGDW
jgi:hypothetical protein